MRRVRYCGGPRDGHYQEWENDRGWPPEICTVDAVPTHEIDYWNIGDTWETAPACTYTRYQRVGDQDITCAELYATGEVITACHQGIPLSAQGIAPVQVAPQRETIRLVGGPHHNERVTIAYPAPPVVNIPVDIGRQWTPDADVLPTEQTILYYRSPQRDAAGTLLYAWSEYMPEYMHDLTMGIVPRNASHDADVMVALTRAAARSRSVNSLLNIMTNYMVLGEGVLLGRGGNGENPFTYDMAYATDAEMSGKKEYPLDAVARENERRSAAIRKAQECIDAIGEVTTDE